ncbi:MAG: hypothetical protein AAGG51_13125 [Cyanobacteria bacterium P01_G01_bin.54]
MLRFDIAATNLASQAVTQSQTEIVVRTVPLNLQDFISRLAY